MNESESQNKNEPKTNGQSSMPKRKTSLKSTVKKIVRANIDFMNKSSKNKDKKSPNAVEFFPLEFFPKEIIFESVKNSLQYSAVVVIQNITNSPLKYKLVRPKSDFLTLSSSNTGSIIPGFCHTIEIVYFANEVADLEDSLKILCGDYVHAVQIHVSCPKGILVLDKKITLGYLQPERTSIFHVNMKNEGEFPILIDFFNGIDNVTLSSENMPTKLEAYESKNITFEALFAKSGHFSGQILFSIRNQPETYPLEITATIVKFSNLILDESGNEINILNFNDFLIGNEEKQVLTIVNNSPVPDTFRISLVNTAPNDIVKQNIELQTPFEAGVELSQQLLSIEPLFGEIAGYGHQKITIKLKKPITNFERNLISKFSISNEKTFQANCIAKSLFQCQFSSLFQFESMQTRKIVTIKAKAYCPLISLSCQSITFGEQTVGTSQTKEIEISNSLGSVSIPLETSCEFFLHCNPTQFILGPKETRVLALTFNPPNLGQYKTNFRLKIAGNYEIFIKVEGSGKISRQLNSERNSKNMNVSSSGFRVSKIELGKREFEGLSNQNQTMIDFKNDNRKNNQKIPDFYIKKNVNNLQPASHFDKTSRKEFRSKRRINISDTNDLNFEEPIPAIPKMNSTLYLIKPLKKGIPKNLKPVCAKFGPSPHEFIKEFAALPKNYEEISQIKQKLNPEMLMRIHAGPVELDFGRIFCNSVSTQYFHVKNDLWTSISVKIDVSSFPELSLCNNTQQIISSSEVSSFRIILSCPTTKQINEKIKYTINEHLSFYFAITANVVLPDLEISKNGIGFNFREDSLEISASQSITLRNTGNLAVDFFIRPLKTTSSFQVIQSKGCLKQGESMEVEFKYNPTSSKDEEVFKLEIENGGEAKEIKCVGITNEVSCEIINSNLNFGNLAIDQKKTMHFYLKNTHSKNTCVFKVDEFSLPHGLEIKPKFGKISAEEPQKFEIEFSSRRKIDYIRHEICLFIRGSTPIKVLFSVSIMVPIVELEPAEFILENTTIGNRTSISFELTNKSSIQAEVHLNLQTKNQVLNEIYNCIEITPITKSQNDSQFFEQISSFEVEKILKEQAKDNQNNIKQAISFSRNFNLKLLKSDDYEESKNNMYFMFYIKPMRSYSFKLNFSPKKPIEYNFDLLFNLQGDEKQRSLIRKVKCIASNPRFLFDPMSGIVEFAHQIMFSVEPVKSEKKTFTIINNSSTQRLHWEFDQTAVDQLTVFKLHPISGIIDEECSAILQIDFIPMKPIPYESLIPIYFNNSKTQSFMLKLKGEGTLPKILLSVEEIILPITPVGVGVFSYLAIMNDGYQNSSFTLIIPMEYRKIGLSAAFMNENVLGISNSKIFVRVSFISSTPVSFSAKIGIEDDLKRVFYFTISGSTDNSIFGYGPFLHTGFFSNTMFRKNLDNFEEFLKFDPKFHKTTLFQFDQKMKKINFMVFEKPVLRESQIHGNSLFGNSHSESENVKKDDNVGPLEYYQQIGKTISSWLLEYGINKIDNFPEDLVESKGLPFYELIDFLVKANLEKPKPETISKAADRIDNLIQIHSKMLNFLKENNAHVNTIRPFFLLSQKDLQTYFKINAELHVSPDYYQINESQYKLISIQSWVVLYLQTIKIFFVSRITIKEIRNSLLPLIEKVRMENNKDLHEIEKKTTIIKKKDYRNQSAKKKAENDQSLKKKNLKNTKMLKNQNSLLSQEKKESENNEVPGFELNAQFQSENNSFCTASEALIVRWLEILHFYITKKPFQIIDIGKDLANCYIFACAIDAYVIKDYMLTNKLNQEVSQYEDSLSNFKQFKGCAIEFGIKDEFVEFDFIRRNPLAMMMMAVQLFKSLPSYAPKMTIEFNCALHEKVMREVQITNPSSKSVTYSIKMYGSKSFETEQDFIKMEPKQSILVPITFYANSSLPAEARVFFQNRKNGKSMASAIVFLLKSVIVCKYSMKVFNITTVCLYEFGSMEITVQNPFPRDVEFKIRLENVLAKNPDVQKMSTKLKEKNKKIETSNELSFEQSTSKDFLPSFFLKQERVWIRKGGDVKLHLQYLPLSNENHRCLINFQDQKVGEMQYEVIGTPKLSVPSSEVKMTIPIEEFSILEIDIPLANIFLRNAISKLADRLKEFKDYSWDHFISRMQHHIEYEFEVEMEANDYFGQIQPIKLNKKHIQNELNCISAEISKPKSPIIIDINNNNNHKTEQKDTKAQIVPSFKCQLFPIKKAPVKDLNLKIYLKGKQKYDFRIYNINLSILPKRVRAIIEMKTTARVSVSQNIPITNSSEIDCLIKTKFTGILNGHMFECNTSPFTIKSKSVWKYSIRFLNNWIGEAECTLVFFNVTSNESFEYQIKGEAEEPVCEDNLQFYTKAKSKTDLIIKIKNPISDTRIFRVETDLPNAVYEKKVFFEDSSPVDFKISYTPSAGGNVMHSITFFDDHNRYFWYILAIKVDSPEPTKCVYLITEIRKPVAGKIEVDNPSEQSMKFKVSICGDYLSSDNYFEVPALSKNTFTFFYFPIKVEEVKRKIGLISSDKNEIWFDIDCKAEESKPVKLPIMKAEIGKSVSCQLTFVNPLKKKPALVRSECSEKSNFKVSQKFFEIAPNSSFVINLKYTPMDINNVESESIKFISREIGNWNYQVFGNGICPSENEPILISTTLKTPVNHYITWSNPFSYKVSIKIIMEDCSEGPGMFEIYSPKLSEHVILPAGVCPIVIKFEPNEIYTYHTKLIIKLSEALQWVYPIKGFTEALLDNKEYVIKTKCEEEISVTHNFKLSGILLNHDEEEVFDYVLEINHKESANIEKWLKVKPIVNKLASSNDMLVYDFLFLPHKPLKTVLNMVLIGKSGGRWKFQLCLIATEPDFFDTLHIVSQFGVKKTIRFQLFNVDKKNSNPFEAHFEDETESDFSIFPLQGILEPKINDGTMFEIGFCPKKYGKAKTAIAIVKTDSHMFRFCVKGSFEKYVPPIKRLNKN